MCFNSTPDNPGATRNDEIEKQLKLDKKKAAKEVKLLLLGERCIFLDVSDANDIWQAPERAANLQS